MVSRRKILRRKLPTVTTASLPPGVGGNRAARRDLARGYRSYLWSAAPAADRRR